MTSKDFRERLYALAAALGCTLLDAAACLRALAGNGRPASLDQHFAQVPRDPEPTPPPWANEPTPLADAAIAFLRRSRDELEAVDTVADLLRVAGEDVQ